jgi:hypothetical protein
MDNFDAELASETSRRRFLRHAALGTAGLAAAPALAQQLVDLNLPGGNAERPMTSAFPGKGSMILQRVHPPLLETPMDVFDESVFTPNDQFFVRWHWADIPTSIDVETFRLTSSATSTDRCRSASPSCCACRGSRWRRSTSARATAAGCSSRVLPARNGATGRWAMRMARRAPARCARSGRGEGRRGAGALRGARSTVVAGALTSKALDIDHARDGEVMIAFGMNGEQLPSSTASLPADRAGLVLDLLGQDAERHRGLPGPDDEYWMAKAYKIPATPGANVAPGARTSRPSRSTA